MKPIHHSPLEGHSLGTDGSKSLMRANAWHSQLVQMTQSSMVGLIDLETFFLNKTWQLIFHAMWQDLLQKEHPGLSCSVNTIIAGIGISQQKHQNRSALSQSCVGSPSRMKTALLRLRRLILAQVINHEVQACLAEEDCGCEVCVFMKTVKDRKVLLNLCTSCDMCL